MTEEEIVAEKKKLEQKISILESKIEQSRIAGIKIEDDMEVDADGLTIAEVPEEEENEIEIGDEEVLKMGEKAKKVEDSEANLLDSDPDEIQESVVMGIVDQKTITKKFDTFAESDEPVLESLDSNQKEDDLKASNIVLEKEEDEDDLQESVILQTRSKKELASDLPSFSTINQSNQPGLTSHGLFNLNSKAHLKKDKKVAQIPMGKKKESDGFLESVIVTNNKTSNDNDNWAF